MSRAIIVPFFRFNHTRQGMHKCLEVFFGKQLELWKQEIDHLYVIDSGWDFHLQIPGLKTTVYRTGQNSHWANLNRFVPQIQEDRLLIIDNDTVLYRTGIVNELFELLDSHDIVSMTDTSGGLNLHQQFPFLQANENRSIRQRFTPYLFACHNRLLKQIAPYDFSAMPPPQWADSMGLVSKQLLDLDPKIYELPDDRTTVYYRADGQHQITTFLDGPEYKWSQECPKSYGYYHIRNFSGALAFVENRTGDTQSYQRDLKAVPRQEALRLLAWFWYVSAAQYRDEILSVVADYGVQVSCFLQYLKVFLASHSYMEKFQ